MSRLPQPLGRVARSRFALVAPMHTSGRQIPHPGQAGSPQGSSISPTPHTHHPLPPIHPSPPKVRITSIPGASTSGSAASSTRAESRLLARSAGTARAARAAQAASVVEPRGWTAAGRPIPARPQREIEVRLPSGYPEPRSYPVRASYINGMESRKREPHPLWQFFHVPRKALLKPVLGQEGPMYMGSLEASEEGEGVNASSRSWLARELRELSFTDLHTLWYVLLRERNVLLTQLEERRREGIHDAEGGGVIASRKVKVRKAMARIKYVLNERRLGLIAAASVSPEVQAAQEAKAQGGVSYPFSASGATDPALGLEALRGAGVSEALLRELYPRGEEGGLELGGMLEEGEGEGEEVGAVVDAQVGKEEVEARDEGWGGGEEAREFVRDVKVEAGHVGKK